MRRIKTAATPGCTPDVSTGVTTYIYVTRHVNSRCRSWACYGAVSAARVMIRIHIAVTSLDGRRFRSR